MGEPHENEFSWWSRISPATARNVQRVAKSFISIQFIRLIANGVFFTWMHTVFSSFFASREKCDFKERIA